MLTLQFIPFSDIAALTPNRRIKKLLDVVMQDRIVLLEGRLSKTEEAELIRRTMEEIDENFKGIEISVMYPEKKDVDVIMRLRQDLANLLLGNRRGITIIGPATIVKEIKKDFDKIQLLTEERSKKIVLKKRGKKWLPKSIRGS
jgi:hypothetical protein